MQRIKPAVKGTHRSGVLGNIGGFGGLFELDTTRYREPVLVAATDGVGTKLDLAVQTGQLDGVGVDLVAMCANDLVVQGAEPLFFLDYYVTGRLDVDIATRVVESICEGCRLAGAALLGGETAEHPGTFPVGEFDLAGFCVGVVEKGRIVDGQSVAAGDAVVGIASSGPHSNGFSLIRRIVADGGHDLDGGFGDGTLASALLSPTRIYVKSILALLDSVAVHGIAHITGGGISENIARVLPATHDAELDRHSWQEPAIFDWLRQNGRVEPQEMWRTFNCGLGMAVIVPPDAADRAVQALRDEGEDATVIGTVVPGRGEVRITG